MIHVRAMAVAALFSLSLSAAQAQVLDSDVAQLDVLPGWTTPQGTQMAGLRITLAPGWKTYWRAPGDAGIPPRFDWSGSQNISGAVIHWPVPETFDLGGMRSLGYHDGVVLPIEFTLIDGTAPASLGGSVELGVCEDICIPVTLLFDAPLSRETRRDPTLAAALIDRPLTEAEAMVGKVVCSGIPIKDGLQVSLTIDMPQLGNDEVVVIEAGNDRIWVSEPVSDRQGNLLSATADMIHVSGGAFGLDRSALRATVIAQGKAVDIQGCTGG